MKRFLPWIGVAVAIPTVLLAAFLLRPRQTLAKYMNIHPGKRYGHVMQIYESSWQFKAVGWLLSLMGLDPLPSIQDIDLGMVEAREVPFLDDKSVIAALAGVDHYDVSIWVGQRSAEQNHLDQVATGLLAPHDFMAFVSVSVKDAGKTKKVMRLAFDRNRVLVGKLVEDRETGEVVIDAYSPGETPHREFTKKSVPSH